MTGFEKSFNDSDNVVAGSPEASPAHFPEFSPPASCYPALTGRNRQVKNAMSDELIAMGLPSKAVARILNLDQE